MPDFTKVVALLQLAVKDRTQLVLENIALRHQLAVYMRSVKRPNIKDGDRIFWLTVMRMLRDWRQAVVFVQPEDRSTDAVQSWTTFLHNHLRAGGACNRMRGTGRCASGPRRVASALLACCGLAHRKRTFDELEVLTYEPRAVHGAKGYVSHLEVRKEGEEALLLTEVHWVRGTVGYLLTMNARESVFEPWHGGFEKLIASFRSLGE